MDQRNGATNFHKKVSWRNGWKGMLWSSGNMESCTWRGNNLVPEGRLRTDRLESNLNKVLEGHGMMVVISQLRPQTTNAPSLKMLRNCLLSWAPHLVHQLSEPSTGPGTPRDASWLELFCGDLKSAGYQLNFGTKQVPKCFLITRSLLLSFLCQRWKYNLLFLEVSSLWKKKHTSISMQMLW